MRLEERFQNSGDGEFDWRLAGRKRQMAFFVGLGIDQPARRSGARPGPAARSAQQPVLFEIRQLSALVAIRPAAVESSCDQLPTLRERGG